MIELNFSEHARSRIRQRGLREKDVQAMVGRAEGEADVGQGLVSLFLTARQRRERRDGTDDDRLPDSALRTAVVIDLRSLTVVTVLKMAGRAGRRYSRA
jgi:hypothetical protein